MNDLLATLEVEPSVPARAAVIWLHGLGASGHDFEPIVPELALGQDAGVRFVFPHAPQRAVTVNAGMRMPAWYDIMGIGLGYAEDEPGVRASEAAVGQLIAREKERGIPSERIVLAGFSQGGAIALHAGVRYPQPLAGIMALSTYVPLRSMLEDERHAGNHETPIFMAHGVWDEVVPFEYGKRSRDLLVQYQHPVEWHEYPMEHQVTMEEIRDIGDWLKRVLSLT